MSEMSDVDGGVLSTTSAPDISKMSLNSGKEKSKGKLLDYLQEKGVLDDREDDGDFREEHEKYKSKYYKEKFKIEDDER